MSHDAQVKVETAIRGRLLPYNDLVDCLRLTCMSNCAAAYVFTPYGPYIYWPILRNVLPGSLSAGGSHLAWHVCICHLLLTDRFLQQNLPAVEESFRAKSHNVHHACVWRINSCNAACTSDCIGVRRCTEPIRLASWRMPPSVYTHLRAYIHA